MIKINYMNHMKYNNNALNRTSSNIILLQTVVKTSRSDHLLDLDLVSIFKPVDGIRGILAASGVADQPEGVPPLHEYRAVNTDFCGDVEKYFHQPPVTVMLIFVSVMCVCMCVYARTHARIYARTHARTHIHTYSFTHARARTQISRQEFAFFLHANQVLVL